MKSLNVKKLAAIGAGATLMGMALAPMAAALTKEDVLKGDGTPFDVVVGLGAAHGDYLWGGNIGAKLAQLATEDTAVSCTATGWMEGKGPTGEPVEKDCEMTESLAVDLAIGGTTVIKSGTGYTYDDAYLDSGTTVEWSAEIGNSKIDNLLDERWSYVYNNSTYTQTVKEFIGITADAKFDTQNDVQDLVAYLDNQGDFNYMMRLGAGIPYSPSYTKADGNNLYVPWFGKKYTVLSASNTEVKLIDDSEKHTYYQGERITGLTGKGDYAGQELEIEFVSLTHSSTQGAYSAKFNLYDAEGNLIDDYPATAPGIFLESGFMQANGGYPLETSVYVEDFAKEDVSDQGYVTVTVGTNTVQLKDGEMYPYDSTITSSSRKYWKVDFTTGTATVGGTTGVNVISEITVSNNAKEGYSQWDDKMPLYSTDDSFYSEDNDDVTAVFLNGESEDAIGYGFATFRFDGFKNSESKMCGEIGADISDYKGSGSSSRGIHYTDDGDIEHYIPFYIEDLDSSSEEDFYFDKAQSKRYYFRMGTNVSDINVCDGEYLSGVAVDINGDGIRYDAGGRANTAGTTYDINGTGYVIKTVANADNNCIILDTNGWFRVQTTSFDSDATGTTSVDGYSGVPFDKNFYFDNLGTMPDDSVYDYATVKLLGDDSEPFHYAYYYDESNDIWLLLDSKTNFAPESSANAYGFALAGTEIDTTTETGTPNASFYVPDDSTLGAGQTTGTYRVAKFTFTEPTSSNTGNVYINTANGKLPPVGNTNLSGYTAEATFTDTTNDMSLTYNESSNLQKVWTDYGTKIWIEEEGAWHMCTPEQKEYTKFSLLGPEAEVTTTGEELEGLVEGDTGTTSGNVKVTVSKIYGDCGTVTCEPGEGVMPGDVELEVSPSVVKKINKIGKQIVYTDDMAPNTGIVVVGGHLVNSKAVGLGLDSKLTAEGDTVVEQTDNGDWVVAGFTATDTVTAAKDFIDMLDAAFVE